MDWFFNPTWLRIFRNHLIEAFDLYHQWGEAAKFFGLRTDDVPTLQSLCTSMHVDPLIKSGRDGPLPKRESLTRLELTRMIVELETIEAEVRAVSRLLMHRTLDRVALVAGLELPRFGVDHALVGAFFSVTEADFPLEDLERHGVPLQGIWILEQRDVRPFDPWRTVTPPECQSIAKAITQRTVEEPRGEFFEIWRMQQATVVKQPSAWYIKYPLELQD